MTERSGLRRVPSHPLRWFPEFWEVGRKRLRPQIRLLGLSLVVGVIAGLGAVVFYLACQVVVHYALDLVVGYHPSSPGGEPPIFAESERAFAPLLLLVVPAVGGLLSGVLVFTVAPEAEGHGTDAAIAAYHHHHGYIRPIVPLVKIIASALTIGSGGSGGREGPIAQIGAGFGSLLGRLLRMRPVERRILMAAGMGAGVAAIFRAPLAGALFAAEVLYWSSDIESDVIIPAALASIMAYCTFGLGVWTFAPAKAWTPLFSLPPELLGKLTFDNPIHLLPYFVLALLVVVLAMIYTRSFYFITHLFHRLRIPRHFKPAIGAFLTGFVGLVLYGVFYLSAPADPADQAKPVLAVLSFGYGSLQQALTYAAVDPGAGFGGNPAALFFAVVLFAVCLGKTLTTGLTIGSGGSGGVFGPSMVIGGCGGGALGILLYAVLPPGWCPHPASFVIVGMAGFFAAASKTPFSTLVIVSEMTGNYNLLLPTLWVCALAFLLSDEKSIYSSQVENRSRSPAHKGDYVREVLTGVRVSQFLTPNAVFPVLRMADSLATVLERLSNTDYPVLPVVDGDNRLQGVTRLEEVYNASQAPNLRPLVLVADLMLTDVEPLTPDDPLDRAMELFVENDLLALPVVDNLKEKKVVGLMRRADVANAYLRFVHGQPGAEAQGAGKVL
jgi:chloride channel protein, CIC family